MNESAISVRYAKALFQTASENNLSTEVLLDIKSLETFYREVPEFGFFVNSPIISVSDKNNFLSKITKEGFQEITIRFLQMITKNKREAQLPLIIRNFFKFYRQDQGILEAILVSATPVKKETLEKIRQALATNYKAKIEIKQETDPNLIGGFILRIEDEQLDASIAAQLKKIKRELDQTLLH